MTSAVPFDPPQRLVRALAAQPDAEAVAVAQAWLERTPELLGRWLERWELSLERVISPGGRSSVVALVRQADGSPATLKLVAPDGAPAPVRAAREHEALTAWHGLGAVRVLRAAPEEGALLLERLRREVSLRSLPEAKATLEAVSVVRRLWVPVERGHGFETVAEHTEAEAALMRSAVPLDAEPLVAAALEARETLLAEPAPAVGQVLLHGDFRQGAVLASSSAPGSGERAPWLTVGPDPLVGEPAYDLARLARDRLHDLMASTGAAAAARRRVNKLADSLDVPRERVRLWALYRAVESAVRQAAGGGRADAEMLLEFAAWL
ncbi:aminoglycoside phosphotransferase family protein [Streptomyces sp. NBC_01795]|uniref:aminoglycoside phosphotransferase family protein n=1 Tax=Streptomyces sp. NBC_01795 TaxID=2975943 RepID=UPI002DDB563C|nr:aminoglycoside phosphotransferase family protein [Streptomyces sp. NBC_01795]WSA92053.1 aminoglycoside phosphotransferase family protein [Streptomyces sp. NBC_01795]